MKISTNDETGKIFIGGLTRTTTKEMLQNEFSKYGDIIDTIIMKNNETGQSRGFGFVTYRDPKSATIAANNLNKVDGKTVDVKLSNTKLAAQQKLLKQKNENCKIFIGGLPHGVTDDEVKLFFQRYGPVREFKMMYDDVKKRPRGFGFITFELEESANQVLLEHYISFKGKQIEVKPQLNNTKTQQQQQQQNSIAQFSWNPATASIEPTWSTLNNVVATAAANVYGNTAAAATTQWDHNTQADVLNQPSAWSGYYNGQNTPNQMLNLNYYGQTQGYYHHHQVDNTTSLDHNQTTNYSQQQVQNQYNGNNNSSSNKLNNNNSSNYNYETSSLVNNIYLQQQTPPPPPPPPSSSSSSSSSVPQSSKYKDNSSTSNTNSQRLQQQQQQQQNSYYSNTSHSNNNSNNNTNNTNSRQYHPYRR